MNRSIADTLKSQNIRKIVWDGPHMETDEGRVIRGSVGLTRDGNFKAAEVTLYEEYGPKGRASFSAETYEWGKETYPLKEQAIFAARSKVADTRNRDRRDVESEESLGPRTTDAATKYGSYKTSAEELHRGLSR